MPSLFRQALSLLFLGCTACTRTPSSTPPHPLASPRAQTGATAQHYRLRPGDVLRLQLEASPASGYTWSFVGPLPPMLRMESDPGLLLFDRVRPGAGVAQRWTFRAERTGRATLHFVYGRPWEPVAAVADQRAIEVWVE